MKIILANGIELKPTGIIGAKRSVQGATRDVLSFVFSAETSMDELDAMFTAENCEVIKIVNGERVNIHNAYTVRAELKCEPVLVTPATDSAEAVYENRVTVSMAQRTYVEAQLAQIAALTETVDYLVMESLMSAE